MKKFNIHEYFTWSSRLKFYGAILLIFFFEVLYLDIHYNEEKLTPFDLDLTMYLLIATIIYWQIDYHLWFRKRFGKKLDSITDYLYDGVKKIKKMDFK